MQGREAGRIEGRDQQGLVHAGAGEVFDSGSSASFAAALDRLDLPSATAGAVRLNEAMLGEVMARRYLAAFEELAAAPARR